MLPNPPPKKPNKWLLLINMPIQMGVLIYASAALGNWLDAKYSNQKNIYVKILVLVGVALAFYNLNRQLQNINKKDQNNEK